MNRKHFTASALLATFLTLMLPAQLPAQNTALKPGKPAWTTPLELKLDSGKARLEWAQQRSRRALPLDGTYQWR
jgi:hypothetical protein